MPLDRGCLRWLERVWRLIHRGLTLQLASDWQDGDRFHVA